MALLKCYNCHQEVPNKVKVCPHCGTSLVKGYKNFIYGGVIVIAFVLIFWKYLDLDLGIAVATLIGATIAIIRGLVGLLKRNG